MAPATQAALPGWSQRLISEVEAADRRAELLVRGLSADQLNWSPRLSAWSIGQCLQHLYMVSEVYLPAISVSLEGRQQSRVEEITPGWFGRWFIRTYIEPSLRSRRARAPKKADPGKRVEPSIIESFLGSNERARALIGKASDYDVNRIRFKNPFIPVLRFTVGTGLEIILKHQCRHLVQAERVRQSPDFPVP